MTPVTQEGIFCTVQASEVEQRTLNGWQLVGVIDAEQTVSAAETEAPSG